MQLFFADRFSAAATSPPIVVEIPPRGRKSPFTSAHTGLGPLHHVFQHLIDDVFLKDSQVAI